MTLFIFDLCIGWDVYDIITFKIIDYTWNIDLDILLNFYSNN